MEDYREEDGEFWGAYGKRVERQVSEVISKLRAYQWTRQAVITLWDRYFDNFTGKKDYPCTVALGFTMQPTLTGRKLDMHVTMRSNDAWLGLPYDMFQFTQLQQTICRVLAVNRGSYTHTAWSMHLYEPDVEQAYDVALSDSYVTAFDPRGLGEPNVEYSDVIYRARTIARTPDRIDWTLTESERWYHDAIHGS
jgi:thymidylate synthase